MSNNQILQEHFDKAVSIVTEKILLDDDLKMLKETVEAEGLSKLQVASFFSAATAKARQKSEDLKEKTEAMQEMLERFC